MVSIVIIAIAVCLCYKYYCCVKSGVSYNMHGLSSAAKVKYVYSRSSLCTQGCG